MPLVKCDECGADFNSIRVQCTPESCAETEAFKKQIKIFVMCSVVLTLLAYFLIMAGRP